LRTRKIYYIDFLEMGGETFLKGEAVTLAKAVASTKEILSMEQGVVAETKRVVMPWGTYPKCWRSGGT
ncbi:MAG: hypothetical protein QMD23_08435, partial [Candidatus Bathyarchaeia archaeon]|nr:hypothetical protein [Candidatus Bathyarchaeia archaeon]